MRQISTCLLLLLTTLITLSQAYAISVFPSDMSFTPASPTTNDFIFATVNGVYSTPGYSLNSAPSVVFSTSTITINFSASSPTVPVAQILDPFSYNVDIGILAAGGYTVNAYFTVDGVLDNGISRALTVSPIPLPASVWLFGSGLIGLVGLSRRMKEALITDVSHEGCYR